MRWQFAVVALLLSVTCTANAQQNIRGQRFPYEAFVVVDEAAVRSGPGQKYYPTGKINRGEAVQVHRHDPGGWYMISPPPGSFSWIRAEYVRPVGGNRGVLTANSVVVRVGSSLGDIRDVEQRRLSTGDQVTILGEKVFQTETGPQKMYRIAPPEGEYRWIMGQEVSTKKDLLPPNKSADPFAPIPRGTGPIAQSGKQPGGKKPAGNPKGNPGGHSPSTIKERPLVKVDSPESTPRSEPSMNQLVEDRQRLQAIDQRFKQMIEQKPSTWKLEGLEQDYQELKSNAGSTALAKQVDLRMDALTRYRKIHSEYQDFLALTSQTDQREAQLLSIQRQQTIANKPAPVAAQPSPPQATQPPADPPANSPSAPPAQSPNGWTPTRTPQTATPAPGAPTTPPRFDGAGIVRRTGFPNPGAPRYMLTAPDGRFLAYLHPDRGVNLEMHLEQPRGVWGRRWYRPDLRADFIVVRSLSPVRLQGMP